MSEQRPDQTTERVPPHDLEAEQAVLGSMMMAEGAAAYAFGIVEVDDFYYEDHRHIADSIKVVLDTKQPIDLVTVSAELRRRNVLQQIGGGTYMTTLLAVVPTAAHVGRYARIVKERALLRRLITASSESIGEAYNNPANVAAAIAQSAEKIRQLQETISSGDVQSLGQTYESDIDRSWAKWSSKRPKTSPERFGINEADEQMGGLGAHSMVVIKASRKDGKSQLLRQAAIESARHFRDEGQGRKVLFIGTEERRELWEEFAWSYISGIDSRYLTLQGWMGPYLEKYPGERRKLLKAQSELAELPLKVIFGKRDWSALRADCQREYMRDGVGLIVIDYFQKLRGGVDNNFRSEEYSYRRRAESMVELGVDLGICILTGSQVSWDPNKKVFITKGASAIEEEALTVIEWQRDVDPSSKQRLNSGKLTCQTARLGTGFKAPIDVITDMSCGRYWDKSQDAHNRAAAVMAHRDARDGDTGNGNDDGAENGDPFDGDK